MPESFGDSETYICTATLPYHNRIQVHVFKMSFNLSTENLFPVDGLVAVVTGAGSGIGSMIVRALATNGASAVYAVDIENYGIEKVAQEAVTFSVLL